MERTGEVSAVQGQWLEITFCRPADCEKCHACHGGPKTMNLRVKGEGKVGDYAVVSIPDGVLAKASALAYLLPLAGLIIGMLLGDALIKLEHSLGAAIGAAAGLAIPLVYLAVSERQRRKDPRWTPQLVRVIPASQQTEDPN